MKQRIKNIFLAGLLILSAGLIYCQNNSHPSPPWVSDQGYWVEETNIHSPMSHVIRFYNNENVLIYTQQLEGVKLDIHKRKVKMKLKKALETALLLSEQNKKPEMISGPVVAILK